MSKKERKTRKVKEIKKTHDFGQPIYRLNKSENEGNIKESNPKVSESRISPYVVRDFKNVLTTIGLMIAFIFAVYMIIYNTDLLNPLLDKLHIKY